MKERILIKGYGQCGGNYAESFQKLGYNVMALNTSNADLMSNKCKIKYHIPAAFGCHGDMKKAVYYAKDYHDDMYNFTEKYFPRQDIVIFIYGSGGGTGAGLVPPMASVMSMKNPNKIYCAVIVLPKSNEKIPSIKNAILSYKQLTNVKGLKCIFVLDNNMIDNKFAMNDIFAHKFDNMINMTNPNVRGVIDESEIEDVLNCRGSAVIEEWDNTVNNSIRFTPSLFTPYNGIDNGCKKLAITSTSKNEIVIKEFAYKIGNPEFPYYGYNEDRNILIATGMNYPDKRIKEFEYIVDNHRGNDEVKGLDISMNVRKKEEIVVSEDKYNNNDDKYKARDNYSEKDIVKVDIKETIKPIDDDYFNKWM